MILIAAADRNWVIGKDGGQPFSLKGDLKRFRALTLGGCVIMGRKTLEALPGGRPLKGRRNIVLSRDPDFAVEGAEVCRSVEQVLALAPAHSFVIGGESVYRAMLPHCSTALITRIDGEFPGDRHLPDPGREPGWQAVEMSPPMEEDGLGYRFVTYRRM